MIHLTRFECRHAIGGMLVAMALANCTAVLAQEDPAAAWAREPDTARLAEAVSLFRTICVENAGSLEGQLAAIPSTSARYYRDRLAGSGYWSGDIQVHPQIGDAVGCGVDWHGAMRTSEREVTAALVSALDLDWGPEQVYRSPELYAWTLVKGDEALTISFMIQRGGHGLATLSLTASTGPADPQSTEYDQETTE